MYCKALIFHMQSRGGSSVGKRQVGLSNPSRDRHFDKTGNDSFTAKRSALGVSATDHRRSPRSTVKASFGNITAFLYIIHPITKRMHYFFS